MAEDTVAKIVITAENRAKAAIEEAGKNIEKMGDQLDAGRGNVARYGAQAEQSFEQVREAIAKMRAAGGDVTELEKKLEDMGKGLEAQAERARKYNDTLNDMKARTGEVRDLQGALTAKFPAQVEMLGKAFVAWKTLTTAYDKTREAVAFLDREFGINVDSMVKQTAAFQQLEAAIDAQIGANDAYAESLENERENIDKIAKAREIMAESKLRESKESVALRESLLGINRERDAELATLIRVTAELEKNGQITEDVNERIRASVQKMVAAYKEAPPELKALAEQYGVATEKAEDYTEALDKSAKAAEKAKEAYKKLAEDGVKAAQKAYDEGLKSIEAYANALFKDEESEYQTLQQAADATAKRVKDLQAELDGLQDRDFLAPSDMNRIEQLESELDVLRERAKDAADEAANAEQVLKAAINSAAEEAYALAKAQGVALDQQIALAKGYDEFGNIVADVNTEIGTAIEKYKELAEALAAVNAEMEDTKRLAGDVATGMQDIEDAIQ